MDERRQQKESQNRWWIVAAVFCAFVALRLLMVSEGSVHLLTWVFFPVYCGYCLSAVILCVLAVRKLRGRPAFPMPMVPAKLANERRVAVALGVFIVVATLSREGALGDELAIDFSAFRATDHMQTDGSNSGTSQSMGDAGAPSFAGRPTMCQLSCSGRGQVCDAVLSTIHCSQGDATPVIVTGSVTVEEPWCYTPWYKDATVQFSAQASFALNEGGGSRSHSMSLSGTIQQDAFGPMSCRAFRHHIGERIGKAVAQSLNGVLQNN